jgi:hypothetical protein
MFSIKIIDSARFLKMPISTRLLYYDLCMRADDDGVVEGFNVLRMTGATEDDLKVLVAKDFIKVLNEDLVSYVIDWKEHNQIRADRKIDSMYKDLLLQIIPTAKLIEPRQRADLKPKEKKDNQWTSNGQQKDSIGKDRLGKDNINNNSASKDDINIIIEEIWKAYPNKKGKADSIKKIPKILKTISKEKLIQAIDRYKADVENQRNSGFKTLNYANGSTFFNGRYMDYLEDINQPTENKAESQNSIYTEDFNY